MAVWLGALVTYGTALRVGGGTGLRSAVIASAARTGLIVARVSAVPASAERLHAARNWLLNSTTLKHIASQQALIIRSKLLIFVRNPALK